MAVQGEWIIKHIRRQVVVIKSDNYLFQTGLCKLLEIKDSDIRITTLMQCHDAVDKGIHIGGAFSATIPLVSLFYGGTIKLDIEDPTRRGQDMFVLSKGHAVATMASIYADLGYFPNSVLKNSRSIDSILKGHPGPILPGVHVSTGPLGQGLSVAEGFALVGKMNPHFDVFCMTGDGELQEGSIWEAMMFSGYKKLDNLCVIVDKNEGQLDDTKQLIVPLVDLDKKCMSFGWRVFNIDGTQYGPVIEALQTFKYTPRDGRPTLIVCRTKKGYGGFSNFMRGHKVTIPDALLEQEIALQKQRQASRISEFLGYYNELGSEEDGGAIREKLATAAREMNLDMTVTDGKVGEIKPLIFAPKTKRAPDRDKKIQYDATLLPKLDRAKEYSAASVVTMSMKVFARDPRVVSLDADLGSTSGLEAGVGFLDVSRALNVGVAEANMMGIGEAFAAMGYNTWASTFCPFFDWRVMRRIAIGYQERLEAMEMKDGWLSEGHGLDLTFLATAPNFETKTNGATHMGNDDTQVFSQIAHLKIIDISCPNQLIGAMKWIMEGNKGLVYMRIMRSPSEVIYDNTFKFEFGKAYKLRESADDRAVIVSSGRGVHEAIAAAIELEQSGIAVGVVDMPSIDELFLLDLYGSGKLIVVAEQNNGYIWSAYMKTLFKSQRTVDTARVVAINALDSDGQPQFIHSATYSQLLDRFGLSPSRLAETVRQRINPSG
jgi:transketolase